MESDNVENPFRPQQPLYHEVDNIVEAYRQRVNHNQVHKLYED